MELADVPVHLSPQQIQFEVPPTITFVYITSAPSYLLLRCYSLICILCSSKASLRSPPRRTKHRTWCYPLQHARDFTELSRFITHLFETAFNVWHMFLFMYKGRQVEATHIKIHDTNLAHGNWNRGPLENDVRCTTPGRFSKSWPVYWQLMSHCSKSIAWMSNTSTLEYLPNDKITHTCIHTHVLEEKWLVWDRSFLQPLLMNAIIITQQNQYSQFLLGRRVGVVLFEVAPEWAVGFCSAQPENKIYGKAVFIADWF